MATGTILHVGEDLCQRIPVMEIAGFVVLQSEISLPAIYSAFDHEESFSAVIFQSDISAPPAPTVREIRSLSDAPLVLFENPAVNCDESDFNLVIPPLTPPAIWLQKLTEVIETSRELRKQPALPREDGKAARSKSEVPGARSAHNRICPIDPDALWNGETGGIPESKPPEGEFPADDSRAKAG
jgi:hypothetical protein